MNQSSSSIISFGVNSVWMPCSELSSLSNLLYALKHYKIPLQVSILDSNVCPKILEKFIDQQKKHKYR